MTQSEIRQLIADGQLRPAVIAAIDFAEKCQLADLKKAFIIISSNIEQLGREWSLGQIPFEEFSRNHARQTQALLEFLDQLPDSPGIAAQTWILDESQYKWRIFGYFALAKIIVLGRLSYHWSQGGFFREEFIATFTLLGAALISHSLVMFDNLLKFESHIISRRRSVSKAMIRVVLVSIVLYSTGLFFAIEHKAMSSLSFAEMITVIALIEVFLGGFIGKVTARFFNKYE